MQPELEDMHELWCAKGIFNRGLRIGERIKSDIDSTSGVRSRMVLEPSES